MTGKKGQRIAKLYVGGRSREILDELARAFLTQGGVEKLTPMEREQYQASVVDRGLSVRTAITELALGSFAARVTGRWIAADTLEDETIPSDADSSETET